MKKLFSTAFLTLALIAAQPASAYEIQAKLDRAMVEYNQNNIGKAADILTEVSDYLRATKGQALSKFMPDAPIGWTSQQNAAGANIMGGSQTNREYNKGEKKITVSFLTDNKFVGSMLSMLSQTPQGATDNGMGMKLYKKFIYTFDKSDKSENYSFNLYVSENLVVSVVGPTLTELLALEFADKIDLEKLKAEAEK